MTGHILAAEIRAIQCRTSKRPLPPWHMLSTAQQDQLAREALELQRGYEIDDDVPSRGMR